MLPKVWPSSDIRLALDYSLFVCNKASMETERKHSEKPFDTVLIPSVWSVGNEHRWVWLDTVGLWWWVACSMTRALCVCVSHLVMSDSVTLWTRAYQVPLSMDFPGKNTGVGCHFLLQGIFLTQGSNPGLPHCRQILYCLSHQRRLTCVRWSLLIFWLGFD